ncbi:MAG: hypothetical protein IKS41_05340 [Alphaproteobacteria bacterium]|nr:hypothetical protein [Alphaproteobacteria bacterium]
MPNNMNANEETDSKAFSKALDVAVPDARTFRGLKPRQRQELMAMYQWLQQNEPDFQDPMAAMRRDPNTPRLIRKATHRKKSPRSHHRQHY